MNKYSRRDILKLGLAGLGAAVLRPQGFAKAYLPDFPIAPRLGRTFYTVDIKSKPDPEIFLTAMQILGAEPGRTIIFEDSETGIRAALAAIPGKVIRVNSTGTDGSPADLETISHFGQVPREIFCRPARRLGTAGPGWAVSSTRRRAHLKPFSNRLPSSSCRSPASP